MLLASTNCVPMGVEVDYPEWSGCWHATEYMFTVAFAIEMIFKVCILRKRYFSDRWNCLDATLVMLAGADL